MSPIRQTMYAADFVFSLQTQITLLLFLMRKFLNVSSRPSVCSNIPNSLDDLMKLTQLAEAAEYTDCISAEE